VPESVILTYARFELHVASPWTTITAPVPSNPAIVEGSID
jgi:hypothetical protein